MSETIADPALVALLDRQSIKVFSDIGPTDDQIDLILRAAVTVPDHGGLRPWRLVVVSGDARSAFGDALADAGREARGELPAEAVERLRSKAFVAPALIAVVARVDPIAKIEVWEQVASAASAGYAITLAAHHLGLGAIWKSTGFRNGAELRRVLDMGHHDEFLGWVNLGVAPADSTRSPRADVDLADIVRTLAVDGSASPYERSS